jgi:diacylglycerol kinase (ATP)
MDRQIELVAERPPSGAAAEVGRVAVVAHRDKTFGPGLHELRRRVEAHVGTDDRSWCEVDKSRKVTAKVARAVEAGATRIVVWGGDGTVQHALEGLRDADPNTVSLGVMPAGTANLFARNHEIPLDFDEACAVALGDVTRRVDVGEVNGERFGVMGGTGLDALMIRDASKGLKNRVGKIGYVWTGTKNLHRAANDVRVRVDGDDWFEGRAGCVLVGNVGTLLGGLRVFEDADPADGRFDVGVISAEHLGEWARLLGKAIVGSPSSSPLLTCTQGRKVDVRLGEKRPFELDGGARGATRRMKFRVRPSAVAVCVP